MTKEVEPTRQRSESQSEANSFYPPAIVSNGYLRRTGYSTDTHAKEEMAFWIKQQGLSESNVTSRAVFPDPWTRGFWGFEFYWETYRKND